MLVYQRVYGDIRRYNEDISLYSLTFVIFDEIYSHENWHYPMGFPVTDLG